MDAEIILTPGQENAFRAIKAFVDDESHKVFILKGYAGTGKTTLMREVLHWLLKEKRPFSLLASTGRAAKILSNKTGMEARTVHSHIYKFTDLNQDLSKLTELREQSEVDETGQLYLNFELHVVEAETETIYIIDEASMISDVEDKTATQAIFGSGKLLTDLLRHDPKGKYIFVGDVCQLPPVMQQLSPALTPEYILANFAKQPLVAELTEIVRQQEGNDIVQSAKLVRRLYSHPQPWKWARFPMVGYRNIHLISSEMELVADYINHIRQFGFNSATLLVQSNRQSSDLTRIIRPALGFRSYGLEKGDLLLITQNNYISGLMNGDLVCVTEVGVRERKAGLTFIKVEVQELFTGRVCSQLLILEILYQNLVNLSQPQQKELFVDFFYRMKEMGIKQKSREFKEMMMSDPYLNAIRAVYGYALTCHKAQGGEWDHVFLDIPRNLPGGQKPYVYQWVYTAMTRASQELYVVRDFWTV